MENDQAKQWAEKDIRSNCTPLAFQSASSISPRAEKLWRLVKEVSAEIEVVSAYLYYLRIQHDDEREYRGGKLKFTGWKWGYLSQTNNPGFVAQWCWRNPDPDAWSYYICLPAYCGGKFKWGQSFDIGNERVTGNEPDEGIIRMVESGKRAILEWVDEYLDHPDKVGA